MKKILFSLLLLLLTTTMGAQTLVKGDMNNDDKVGISDVTFLVNVILGKSPVETIDFYAVDNSRIVGTWYAANGTSVTFRENGTTDNPDGTIYQYMPIPGLLLVYDAKGEIIGGKVLKTVKHEYLEEENRITGATIRYTNSAYLVTGIVLDQTTLSLAPGTTGLLAATVSPTTALNTELIWTSSDEVVATVSQSGLVTAVGDGTCTVTCAAQDGSGVTATCEVTVVQLVNSITLDKGTLSLNTGMNKMAQLTATVSPSNASNKNVAWTSTDEAVATVSQTGLVTAVSGGTCTITCAALDGSGVTATCEVKVLNDRSGVIDGHVYVDLDLPSGTLWAAMNIGATNPEDYGDYFAWAETNPKTTYDWNTYKYFQATFSENTSPWASSWNNLMTKYCSYNLGTAFFDYPYKDNKYTLDTSDDAAYVQWGKNWRMPSHSQCQELFDNYGKTTIEWTTQGGVNGYLITSSSNGNTIFLPAGGRRSGDSLEEAGTVCYYWSCSLNSDEDAHFMRSSATQYFLYMTYYERYFGHSVRPVLNKE